MSAEAPHSHDFDTNRIDPEAVPTPDATELRASVLAGDQEEYDKLTAKKPLGRRAMTAIGAGIAGTIVAAGGIFMALESGHNAEAKPAATNSADATPTPSAHETTSATATPSPSSTDVLKSSPVATETAPQTIESYRDSLSLDKLNLSSGQPTEADIEKVIEKLGFSPVVTQDGNLLTTAGITSAVDLFNHDMTTFVNAVNVNKNNPAAISAIKLAFAKTHVHNFDRNMTPESGLANQMTVIATDKLATAKFIRPTDSHTKPVPTLMKVITPAETSGTVTSVKVTLTFGFNAFDHIPSGPTEKTYDGADMPTAEFFKIYETTRPDGTNVVELSDPTVQ